MTLNITVLTPSVIVQTSDRRMVDARTGKLLDDGANKAVVVHCADGVLAVTFAGIGRVGNVRIDDWLLESMQDAGIAELEIRRVCPFIANAATHLFREFPLGIAKRHAFVVAGWTREGTARAPKCWVVANGPETVWGDNSAACDRFSVRSVRSSARAGQVVLTGMLDAVSRNDRKRLAGLLSAAKTAEAIEASSVAAIRGAAAKPAYEWAIGKSCMAVSLTPSAAVSARCYGDGDEPWNWGPHLLWYYGGRSFSVADVQALPSGNYALAFGGGPTPIKLVVSSAATHLSLSPLSAQKLMTRFKVRLADAKHRIEDEIKTAALCEFIPMHNRQPAQPRGKASP